MSAHYKFGAGLPLRSSLPMSGLVWLAYIKLLQRPVHSLTAESLDGGGGLCVLQQLIECSTIKLFTR